MIEFKAIKLFGRVDHEPLSPMATVLCELKGRKLQQCDIDALLEAGFNITIH